MTTFGIIAAIVATLAAVGGSIWSNVREQKNYTDAIEYNKPINQVTRLEEAGLNPNLAAGASNTVSVSQPSVTNPAESLIGGMSNIAQMYNQSEGIQLRKANQRLNESKLALSQLKMDLTTKLVEQQLSEGNIDLAMKLLNYDTAMQSQPFELEKAMADAGLSTNRKSMSDIDLLSYDDYVKNRISQQRSSINKTDAETFYLQNVKPRLEWSKVGIQKMSAEEVQRHNKELELAAKRVYSSNDAKAKREYNLAVKKYNLAVRQQKWDEAHYWINQAFAVAGSATRTFLYGKGINVR